MLKVQKLLKVQQSNELASEIPPAALTRDCIGLRRYFCQEAGRGVGSEPFVSRSILC